MFIRKCKNSSKDEVLSSKNEMKLLFTRRSISSSIFYKESSTFVDGDTVDKGEKIVDSYLLENKELNENIEIRLTSIFLLMFSVVSFLFDVGSDCYLIFTYHKEKDYVWFILSLVFVLIPALVMTTFSLLWYWMDNNYYNQSFTKFGWFVRITLHILQASTLVRYIDTLIYAWKMRRTKDKIKKEYYYSQMIYEEADSSLLRMIECTMESTPQFLLQLYILFTQPKVKNIQVVVIQVSSSIFSLISLSWCLTSYQSSLRITTAGKKKMTFGSMILMVIWKVLFIFPRLLSIALFTSIFKLYVLILLGSHYFVMSLYIISRGTTFYSKKKYSIQEILFNLVVAFMFCIDYLNVKEGSTRIRYTFFYIISFFEICALILLWYFNPPPFGFNLTQSSNFSLLSKNTSHFNYHYQHWSQNVRISVVLATIASFPLAVFLMIVYYLRCHPTNNIKVCLNNNDLKSRVREKSLETFNESLIVHLDSNPTMLSSNINQDL